MTFNRAIESIMPEVESGSKEPFIIFRNSDGVWHCDTTVNQYGEEYDWVEEVQDPFAVTLTGADLAGGSFPYVYDRILNERLRAEFENAFFPNTDQNELRALMNLFEENISEFSSEVTEHLTLYDRPLAVLYEMTSVSLVIDDPYYNYDPDKLEEFITAIEAEVQGRLNNRSKQENPKGLEGSHEQSEKTETPANEANNTDGYTVISKLSINESDIVFSENPDAEHRYMVVENRHTPYYNNSGDNNIYTGHTNDYLEAITEFTQRVQDNVNCVQSTRDLRQRMDGVDYVELKNADCLPESRNDDFTGKLIIVKAEELKPEYRSSEHQLVICSHGNGAKPNAKGTSVFGKELLSGETVCFGRHQIEGVADPAKLPEWAMKKITVHEALKEPGVFKFGDYHFKPHRKYDKSEMSKDNTVSDCALRRMSSDFGVGISAYEWRKDGVDYSHANFYAASGNSDADIFICVENGKQYVPAENELFLYKEPPLKEQEKATGIPIKKPTLQEKMESAKEKVREADSTKPDKNEKSKPKRDGRE